MKKKLFAVITIILILTAAYWYGGSSDNSHGWLIRDDNSPASEQYVSGAGSGADMQTDSNESEAVQGAAQADIDQESNVIPDDNIDGTDDRENYKVNNTGSDGAGTDKAESGEDKDNRNKADTTDKSKSDKAKKEDKKKDSKTDKKGNNKSNNSNNKKNNKNTKGAGRKTGGKKDNTATDTQDSSTKDTAADNRKDAHDSGTADSTTVTVPSAQEKAPGSATAKPPVKSPTKAPSKATSKPTAAHTAKADAKATSKPATKAPVTSPAPKGPYCYISINCSDIVKNMDMLVKGKEKLVPADGVILAKTAVSIKDGDTVFDILKRVVKDNSIHLEYSYTPVYDSYYIEGIANLYEFDCGDLSGWLYNVNDEYINVGMSQYDVSDGDIIKIWYTCDYTS